MTPVRPAACPAQGMGPCPPRVEAPRVSASSNGSAARGGVPPSPQEVTPTTAVRDRPAVATRATHHDASPGPQRSLARPPSDASGPRRGPSGWLRDPLGVAAVDKPELARAPYGAAQPGVSDDDGDPSTLAYQVAETFLDEGRRGMQRWMKPLAGDPGMDLSQLPRGFAALPNLEMLTRLASDAAAQLGRLATDRTPRAATPLRGFTPPVTSAPPPSPEDSSVRRWRNDAHATTEATSARSEPEREGGEGGDGGDGGGGSGRPRRAAEPTQPQVARGRDVLRSPLPPADQRNKHVAWGEIVKLS